MSKPIRERIQAFIADNPGSTAKVVAVACFCTDQTVRNHAKALGLQLAHGNAHATAIRNARPPADIAAEVIKALNGPLMVSTIREVVNQWLETRAPTLAPTDEQVAKALQGDAGADAVVRALRAQGYAGIYSALHRNNGEVLRMALHTPHENAEKRSSVEDLGNRFSVILGDHRGDVMMNAFFSALGAEGRRVFGDAVRKIVSSTKESGT